MRQLPLGCQRPSQGGCACGTSDQNVAWWLFDHFVLNRLEPAPSSTRSQNPVQFGAGVVFTSFWPQRASACSGSSSWMLDHHHGSGIRLERFEHVGRIGEVTDVVAGMQQHRLIGQADISAAAAQHHMFHSAWRVGQRLAYFAGLHLEP